MITNTRRPVRPVSPGRRSGLGGVACLQASMPAAPLFCRTADCPQVSP